jgi:hypothetical protein
LAESRSSFVPYGLGPGDDRDVVGGSPAALEYDAWVDGDATPLRFDLGIARRR